MEHYNNNSRPGVRIGFDSANVYTPRYRWYARLTSAPSAMFYSRPSRRRARAVSSGAASFCACVGDARHVPGVCLLYDPFQRSHEPPQRPQRRRRPCIFYFNPRRLWMSPPQLSTRRSLAMLLRERARARARGSARSVDQKRDIEASITTERRNYSRTRERHYDAHNARRSLS